MARALIVTVTVLVVLTASFACAARCVQFTCEPQAAKVPPCHQQKSSTCQAPQLVAVVKADAPLAHVEAVGPVYSAAVVSPPERIAFTFERALSQADPLIPPYAILRI